MPRRRFMPLAVVAALLLVAGFGLLALRGDRPGAAPAGQPAVRALELEGLRQEFNAAAAEPRLLVLLSPT